MPLGGNQQRILIVLAAEYLFNLSVTLSGFINKCNQEIGVLRRGNCTYSALTDIYFYWLDNFPSVTLCKHRCHPPKHKLFIFSPASANTDPPFQ